VGLAPDVAGRGRDGDPRRAGSQPSPHRRDARRLHARGPDRPRRARGRADSRRGRPGLLRPAADGEAEGGAVIWVNQVVQGILLGGYYALLATGLSLLFGVMRIINLAHGDLAVLGTFLLWWLHDRTGMSVFVALAIVLPVMAALGWILQRAMFE